MIRTNTLVALSDILEAYLEERQATWKSGGEKFATLPSIKGKLNLEALIEELRCRGPDIVKPDDRQHFYRKPALRDRVNEVATAQGLKGIGSRLPNKGDEAVRQRIVAAERTTSDLRREAAEREALIEAQRAEIAALREQFRMLEETGMVLRAGGVS